MEQGKLFENPIAHTRDPVTSKRAADEMTKSRRRGKHAEIVLDLVRRHPGSTALELAQAGPLEEYQVRRRLTDLLHAGLIARGPERTCRVRGSQMVTWRTVDASPEKV